MAKVLSAANMTTSVAPLIDSKSNNNAATDDIDNCLSSILSAAASTASTNTTGVDSDPKDATDDVVATATQSAASASSPSPSTSATRGDARLQVAEKWANRRRRKQQQQQQQQQQQSPPQHKQAEEPSKLHVSLTQNHVQVPAQSPSGTKSLKATATPTVTKSVLPVPLCLTLMRSWNGMKKNLQYSNASYKKKQQNSNAKSFQSTQEGNLQPNCLPSDTNITTTDRSSFPSILNILKAHAMKEQMELFSSANRNATEDQTSGNGSGKGTEDAVAKAIFSVLPSNYNFQQAIEEMSQSRSRAFLLLDLAAIVNTHVLWRKVLHRTQRRQRQQTIPSASAGSSSVPSTMSTPHNHYITTTSVANNTAATTATTSATTTIRMVFATQHNANPTLLQVLDRLGVIFQVSNTYDLKVCRLHAPNAQLLDDPTYLSKPNSYYRRLIFSKTSTTSAVAPTCKATAAAPATKNDTGTTTTTTTTPIAVDGPEEVHRLVEAMTSIAQRNGMDLPEMQFILKLDPIKSPKGWLDCFLNTMDATNSYSNNRKDDTPKQNVALLVGVALQVDNGNPDQLSELLQNLTKLLNGVHQEGEKQNKPVPSSLQLHLTNTSSNIDSSFLDWLSAMSSKTNVPGSDGNGDAAVPKWSVITLDVSHLLVANAGALCTRIIGVKENEAGKIHYYIDDGCYGSLSNYSKNSNNEHMDPKSPPLRPLPLKSGQSSPPKQTTLTTTMSTTMSNETTHSRSDDSSISLSATVWGPTCDGLDKVCSDIPLPRLSRDDWLVFGNLGFCHVGTSFNGFNPPDMAFCVLGGNNVAAAGGRSG